MAVIHADDTPRKKGPFYTGIFFQVAEDNKIFSFFITCTPRSAKAAIHTSKALQLHGNMGYYLANSGSSAHHSKEVVLHPFRSSVII